MISETKPLSTSMLDDAGRRPGKVSAADVRTTVAVFQRFAAVPVEDAPSPEEDGDGVLAQFGTPTFDGVRGFCADLTRRFIEAGAGDEDAMWQLHCTLHWTPRAEAEALGSGHLWSFGRPLHETLHRCCRPSRLGMGAARRTGPSNAHDRTGADLTHSLARACASRVTHPACR